MENQNNEIEPELKEKVKKNVLYIGILSILMLFAGFSSAYVVMMSDAFWLKLRLPNAFWISTVVIAVSSATIYLALKAAKKGNKKGIKLFVTLTFLLGLTFTYYQFKGWGEMYDTGNSVISPTLNPGPYGKVFSLRYNGEEVYFDDEVFKIQGEEISKEVEKDIINFSDKIFNVGYQGLYEGLEYGSKIIIVHKPTGEHLSMTDGIFFFKGEEMSLETRIDLIKFTYTVGNKVGYFFSRGDYGTDYTLMYNNEPVQYTEGKLTIDGKPLDGNQINILEADQNMTGTFIYLLSFLHWLHLLGGMLYLISLLTKSYRGVFDEKNHLQIKLGGIYWHFLGILWVYLFLFLQYIH